MSKPLGEFLKEEKEAEEAAARPPPSVHATSQEIDSPRSDPSMKLSDFTDNDDSVSFELQISEAAEKKKKLQAEKDAGSSKTEGATPSDEDDSTKSEEGFGSESAELAKKDSPPPQKCTTMCESPPSSGNAKKSVKLKLQRHDEALKQTTSLLMSYRSMRSPELSALIVESLMESSAAMVEEAWERLKRSFVYYRGKPVGTVSAMDPIAEAVNYNQPSGLNFLICALFIASVIMYVMLLYLLGICCTIVADFGSTAIGRVAPVDSGFCWITYDICTGHYALVELPVLILNLCPSDGFETFPTLLCADGCSMINSRMFIYGYPVEIQALFYFALRWAMQLLKPGWEAKELLESMDKSITALSFPKSSNAAIEKLNAVRLDYSIPNWVFDFMPLRGGGWSKMVVHYAVGTSNPAQASNTFPAASSSAGAHKCPAAGPSTGAQKHKREVDFRSTGPSKRIHLMMEHIDVYWIDNDENEHFVGMVEGVYNMVSPMELEMAVTHVLVHHQLPAENIKVYYSIWTDQVLVELPILTTPWDYFKDRVRGVQVRAFEDEEEEKEEEEEE